MFRAVAWIGPMIMLLGEAIGSGELLVEPIAGARFGATLFWVIIFIIVTKALWNETIGRTALVTGRNFLEICSDAGPLMRWVPWLWYPVNLGKDLFLRGGIVALAGLVCYDTFGDLPAWMLPPSWALPSLSGSISGSANELRHVISWTGLNFAFVWLLLTFGGYRLTETLNTALTLVFTFCLITCAAFVVPEISGDLVRGLVPRIPPSEPGNNAWLMIAALAGIVMAGSGTVRYIAWAEERRMGLFEYARDRGRELTREDSAPRSEEEIRRMKAWLRVSQINIALTYLMGFAVCASTFILGVAILRPAGVDLTGPRLARELSLMMTDVWGNWARGLFYDGSSRMYLQPLRRWAPAYFNPKRALIWQKSLVTVLMAGSWIFYTIFPEPTVLVILMGLVDAPLVGILVIAYACLARFHLPPAYRIGALMTGLLFIIGSLYLACGLFAQLAKIS